MRIAAGQPSTTTISRLIFQPTLSGPVARLPARTSRVRMMSS
jgi:hypothetical protein